MALELSLGIKNELLRTPFVDIGDDKLYLSIPTAPGAPQSAELSSTVLEFISTPSGMLKLKIPVYITVPSGTTIDAMYISTIRLTNNNFSNTPKDIIHITEDDVVTYANNGIHVVEEINIGAATL